MNSRIDEMVLETFRVDEGGFRDIDSIVRQHCDTVSYYIHRDTLGGYDTADVDELLKERNGSETRITAVMIHASGAEELKFNVNFNVDGIDMVTIDGECEDRARLTSLAIEARAVIKDRMQGARLSRRRILYGVAVAFFILGYFGFEAFQNSYANKIEAEQLVEANRIGAPTERALIQANQRLLTQAMSALSKHDLNAEVSILVQEQVTQLQEQVSTTTGSQNVAPLLPVAPWWSNSYWLVLAVASTAAVAAVGTGYLAIASDRSVFLIGSEKTRQERGDRRREFIRKGIGGAVIVTVLSTLILNLI